MVTRTKVSFFITSLAGGGAERAVINIITALSRYKNLEISLIVNKLQGPNVKLIPEGIEVVELGSKKLAFCLPKLVASLRRLKPDIVVSHLWEINILSYLAKISGFMKFKLILCEHSSISRKRPIGCNLLRKLIYPRADSVVAVSEGIAQEAQALLGIPKFKVTTIYNPVITSDFLSKSRQPASYPWPNDGVPIVVGVGRLSPEKRFDRFLEVISEVNKISDVRGLILGEGQELDYLGSLARNLGIADKITFYGFSDNPLSLMSKASCLLLTSDVEGLPTVVIEAAALGIPCIVTDCCRGVHEIKDSGAPVLITPSNEARVISSLVLEQLSSPISKKWDGQPFTEERSMSKWYNLITGGR